MSSALESRIVEAGKNAVRMTTAAGSGHPSSALSLAHLVSTLMYQQMHWDPPDPWNPGNDRLVLSEGHAVPIVYAVYADLNGAVALALCVSALPSQAIPLRFEIHTVSRPAITTVLDQTSVEKCSASASSAWLLCFFATRYSIRERETSTTIESAITAKDQTVTSISIFPEVSRSTAL